MEASGEHEEEWVDVVVGVELRPWPDRSWLAFWHEEDLDWPGRFAPPALTGRKLIFEAREDELEDAWAAVKGRVEATNRAYREEFSAAKHARASLPDTAARTCVSSEEALSRAFKRANGLSPPAGALTFTFMRLHGPLRDAGPASPERRNATS